MRITALIAVMLIAGGLIRTGAESAQVQETSLTIDAIATRVMRAESALRARMAAFQPFVEVYAQHVDTRESLGSVPVSDEYFFGRFELIGPAPTLVPLTPEKSSRDRMMDKVRRLFELQLNFDGLAAMTMPDWRLIDDTHHTFSFLRRERLGEVRCLVFEVAPLDSRNGFTGRIWVEDRDFNIVRFNGVTRSPASGGALWFSADSWRVNVKPGLWLPLYVYSELQSDKGPRVKSHVRLWGYSLKSYPPPAEARDAVERLSQTGLLAPPGEVDQVLSTVITNLLLTNNLTIEPVATRVLLTSPLESFALGRTIVLSRGLIDVLPDEASLAMILAHELAHIVLGHRAIEATRQYTVLEEAAADARMIELLTNSPYRDKLANAGSFLRAVSEHSTRLTNLIQPQMRRLSELIQKSPALSPGRPDQAGALALGARVAVDAWDGSTSLLRGPNVAPVSAREKVSMAVTPLVPYLRYVDGPATEPKN